MSASNVLVSVVIDVRNAEKVARFWVAALGWRIVERGEYGISIGIEGGPCEIDFRTVPDEPKTDKNRVHLDITPVSGDLAAEHDRLLSLGARERDVGQGQRRWYVLADPEGNEFCLCPAPTRPPVSVARLPAGAPDPR